MRPVKTIVLASCLLTSFSLFAEDISSCQNYDIYVMRHLPKEEPREGIIDKDPDLNEQGKQMALELSELNFMKQVAAGFSTDYRRTKQTIQPSATRYGFEVYTYEPRNNDSLIETIHNEYCGKSVAIVGHSNTVPGIVRALGGKFEVQFAGEKLNEETQILLAESDYGAIFNVKKEQGIVQQAMFNLTQ